MTQYAREAHTCFPSSGCAHDLRNRGGEALPLRGLLIEGFTAGPGQGVVFGAAVVIADGPLRTDPAVLFEFVQRWIEGALAHLENVAGDLADALCDGPAVHRLQGDDFEDQQVEGALDEIRRFAQ